MSDGATALTEDEIEALLTRFTNALHIRPLDVSKSVDAEQYVEGLHGDKDAVGRMRKEIVRIEGGGVFLFTGQPGSGKSTELQRLRRDLLAKGCKVWYCDLEEWLNLSAPVTLSSFLVALLSAWVDQAGTLHGKRSAGERLIDFFRTTQLVPESLKLDAAAGPIKGQIQFALQSDADFRKQLEAKLRSQLSTIVAQAHRFAAELKMDLCPAGEKCVLLADSLEKMQGFGEDKQKVYDSVLQMFVNDGKALRFPGVHVLYSVPAYLLEQNKQLPSLLGTGVVVDMPSVHVFERSSDRPDDAGLDAVMRLIGKRFAGWRQVFTEPQMRRLAMQTGGDLRDFLRAIRIAMTDDVDALPLADEAIDYALGQVTPSKVLPAEHITWMAGIEASHQVRLGDGVDGPRFNGYLATKHVLIYLNGDAWYAVHPLLRDWIAVQAAQIAAAAAAAVAAEAPPRAPAPPPG